MTALKRVAAPVLAAVWIGLLAATSQAEPIKLTFLHVNDVYEISPKDGKGGFAELMTLLRKERAAADHSITTFGGDLFSPSIMSGLTKGAQMVELMNAIGTDVAVPGNHEYDFGPEVATKRYGESKFPWLGANVLGKDGKPAGGLVATKVIEIGGVKIGFFGLLDPETDVLSSPGPNITFAPPIEAAKTAVKDLQAAGAKFIVALTHIDFAEDRKLARSVKGINLILGGHDHEPITFFEKGVMIYKSGTNAHHLGAVDMTLDWVEKRGKTRLTVLPAWRMTSTAGVAPDPEIAKIVNKHNATLDAKLNVAIGKTAVQLDSRRASVRGGETAIGNLIAEAMRTAVGADVGLTNGGGIRGKRIYDPGTTLTHKDILTELPFGDVTALLELSGADLLAALENGVSQVEDNAGRFPQIAGMTLVYDPKAPTGSRVVAVTVGGEPLDKGKTYTLATNGYVANGGDGYASLKNAKQLIDASAATLVATTVMDYIAQKGEISPKLDGRIKTK